MAHPSPSPALDLEGLVNSVADAFERDTGITVDVDARRALLRPALEHEQQLSDEIAQGKVTLGHLRQAVRQVIDNARRIGLDATAPTITAALAIESMRKQCPYVPWC